MLGFHGLHLSSAFNSITVMMHQCQCSAFSLVDCCHDVPMPQCAVLKSPLSCCTYATKTDKPSSLWHQKGTINANPVLNQHTFAVVSKPIMSTVYGIHAAGMNTTLPTSDLYPSMSSPKAIAHTSILLLTSSANDLGEYTWPKFYPCSLRVKLSNILHQPPTKTHHSCRLLHRIHLFNDGWNHELCSNCQQMGSFAAGLTYT